MRNKGVSGLDRARPAAAVVPVVAALVLLAGCGGGTRSTASADPTTVPEAAGSSRPAGMSGDTSAPPTPERPDISDLPDPALSGQPMPTLPPGDPGTGGTTPGAGTTEGGSGGPSGPDGDNAGSGNAAGDGTGTGSAGTGSAGDGVPLEALLDGATVEAAAGGAWEVTIGGSGSGSVSGAGDGTGTGPCGTAAPVLAGAAATRTQVLATRQGSPGGRLAQSVSVQRPGSSAEQSVTAVGRALRDCGFSPAGDPRLGAASEAFTAPSPRDAGTNGASEVVRALVVSAEGVTVVLIGSGSATAAGSWASLTDLALGTSCAAATAGCH